jgi:hypothetical protein
MRKKNSKRLKELGSPSGDPVVEATCCARRHGLTKDGAMASSRPPAPVAFGGNPSVKQSRKPRARARVVPVRPVDQFNGELIRAACEVDC